MQTPPTALYSPAFMHASAFVLSHEGGRVNHPKDPGGDTFMGISRRAYPYLDFDALTVEKATMLYHRDYWKAAYCHPLPDGVSLCVFDGAVQHGTGTAIRLLQEIVGTKVDGKFGSKTLAAVNAACPDWLCSRYALRRARLYARIVKKAPDQGVFLEGWYNRLRDLVDTAWEVL